MLLKNLTGGHQVPSGGGGGDGANLWEEDPRTELGGRVAVLRNGVCLCVHLTVKVGTGELLNDKAVGGFHDIVPES